MTGHKMLLYRLRFECLVLFREVLETLGGGIQLVEVGGPWRILSLAPSSYFSLLPVFNEVHRSSTTYPCFHDGQA